MPERLRQTGGLLIGLFLLLFPGVLQAKKLVVYYSHTGDTQQLAKLIQQETGADILELQPKKAYPDSYAKTVLVVKKQQLKGQLPALKSYRIQPEQYDTIYLGFPNWFAQPALPVQTFLKHHTLAGKKIFPFCSYGVGGFSKCIQFIKDSNPQALIQEALGVSNKQLATAQQRVQDYVQGRAIVGAFGTFRALTADDRQVFETAISAKKRRLQYEPRQVSTQGVAGTNYLFDCVGTNAQGEKKNYQILVFQPLPGRGEAQVISIERK